MTCDVCDCESECDGESDSPDNCRAVRRKIAEQSSPARVFARFLPPPPPARSAAELADVIDGELSNPGLPPGWDEFSEDEWRVVVAALERVNVPLPDSPAPRITTLEKDSRRGEARNKTPTEDPGKA